MKKFTLIFTLGLFVSLMGIMSCGDGGSDEDRQKAIQDSIRQADSIAAIAAASLADSIAYADSVRVADSLAALEDGAGVRPINNGGNNNGGNNTPVEDPPVVTPDKTNDVKPDKGDRGNNTTDKPGKDDRGGTTDGDNKNPDVKPGKRNR